MEAIKLSDIRKELPFNIQKNMFIGHAQHVFDNLNNNHYQFDFDVFLPSKNKNLQRDYCWTLDQKRELILSVIKGTDIQYFSVIVYTDERIPRKEPGHRIYKIIDGKQRLSTLLDFYNNKFSVILLGKEYLYTELSEDIKDVFDWFDIHFNQTYEYYDRIISDDDKIAWFEQINFAGTPQDNEHLAYLKS